MDAPRCQDCRFYYITWQPEKPFGCRGHGFISKQVPSQVVASASAMECQLFELNPKKAKENRPEVGAAVYRVKD